MIKILSFIKRRLEEKENLLNEINVFPVADKDTGSNLRKTFDIEEPETDDPEEYISKLAEKLMNSARGSSGNLIALFVLGLSNSNKQSFSDRCLDAAEFAWSIMYNPKEGTILSAMKEVPRGHYKLLRHFIYDYIDNSIDILLRSPDVLPVLKERGTLDSGILGFIYVLFGLYEFLTGEKLELDINIIPPKEEKERLEYRYCTEILLKEKNKFDESLLESLGDEQIIARLNGLIKIHIHTNTPDAVWEICNKAGSILDYKVDDMEKQTK